MRQGEGTDIDTSTSLQRARANTARALYEHTVEVHRNSGPRRAALCGQSSTYGWVLNPDGLTMGGRRELLRCPKCERLEEEQSRD